MIQKKFKFIQPEENVKITKRARASNGYASSYNTEMLNLFNPELKVKLELKVS